MSWSTTAHPWSRSCTTRRLATPRAISNVGSVGGTMAIRNRLVSFAVAVGLLMSVPLAAHHGSAAFDVGKKVTLKGTVKEWAYLNPHCLLTLVVTGDDGKEVQWVVETQAPNVVFPVGYRKDSFKAGDQVTIIVEPVKN